jgi:hypothetical protein
LKREYRELIEFHLQDNCTEEQLKEILSLVETDEDFRKDLAEAGRMQGLLFAAHKESYDGITSRVQKSITEMDPDSLELKILQQLEVIPKRTASKKWAFALWAAIAAQIVFAFILFNNKSTDLEKPVSLAALYSESDSAWLIRNDKKLKVTADMRLFSGDQIVVEEKGDLRITWNDSTVIQFKDESSATFISTDGAKHIHVKQGKLLAQVTKQSSGKPLKVFTPNSSATVLGTRFLLKANKLESMLEVKRGVVKFERKADGKSVIVKAHEYAVSSPNQPLKVLKSSSSAFRSHEINLDTKDRKVEIVAEINGSRKLYLVVHDGTGGRSYDHAGWLEPRLEDALGRQLSLLDLQWKFADCEWGVMGIGIDALGKKFTHNKVHYPKGIGTHAVSLIEYDIPEGYRFFKATGVITDSGSTQKRSRSSVVFEVYTDFPEQRYRKIMLNKGGK